MNKLICPFCQQELNYLGEDIYYCPNHQKYMGSEELWQELIRTRKALNVAVDALKEIKYIGSWAYVGGLASAFTEPEIAQQALEQISELEQKDVK